MAKQIEPQPIIEAIDQIIDGFKALRNAFAPEKAKPPIFREDVKILAAEPEPVLAEPEEADELGNFDALKKALQSDRWPEAVNKSMICDPESDSDKTERGKGIIEILIEEDLKDRKFLDYGCGEGYCAHLAADYKPLLSVGYDVKQHDHWATFPHKDNALLTNTWNDVVERGPYDVVLLFDVLDHIQDEDPTAVLKRIKSVLAPNGKIYARFHPFTARHATHLYHEINKAFIHLVFTPEEIRQLLPESKYEEHNIGVLYPIKTYTDYILKSGLKVVTKREITERVEPFFKIPKIAERIMRTTKFSSFPEFQMSLQFVDFVITAGD